MGRLRCSRMGQRCALALLLGLAFQFTVGAASASAPSDQFPPWYGPVLNPALVATPRTMRVECHDVPDEACDVVIEYDLRNDQPTTQTAFIAGGSYATLASGESRRVEVRQTMPSDRRRDRGPGWGWGGAWRHPLFWRWA